ncbi:MAG TPA: replication-relaxation family protein [Xanthobacteraceae bacterium]|nr:replication-relaxation family protein [Xanthobacteraceae bacterium]
MDQRRSRMRRTGTGRTFGFTTRDLVIFGALARYRYLRSTYLFAFAGGASETRFKERLGDFFHEGFIDRPKEQWEFADGRFAPVVYELGERGRHSLRIHGEDDTSPRTFLAPMAHRQFAHALMICECLASIELAVRARRDLRFIPWAEIFARMPEDARMAALPFRVPVGNGGVVPDGLFGLEYRAGDIRSYRFFALEADRGTMPIARTNAAQTSYRAKLAAYQAIIERRLHKQHWGISSLFVLTVTTNPERLGSMLKICGAPSVYPLFLFKAVEPKALTVPKPGLLSEPWERTGLSALSISESG